MAIGDQSKLAAWLDFAKALIWPLVLVIFIWMNEGQFADLTNRITEGSIGPGGASFKLQAKERADGIIANLGKQAQPQAPSDPTPSVESRALVKQLEALQVISEARPQSTNIGWIYCGQMADGHWTRKPNLDVRGPVEPGKSYSISTDTYLRESPPEGSTPKGQVMGVVPQGAKVTALQVSAVPDQSEAGATLIWVMIENKKSYGLSRNS